MRCISPKFTVRVHCISKFPSVGCDGREMTNGSVIPRGGETMEASRIFSRDTCLTEFDQGWVRGLQSPSGSKNWQREDTNQITSWLILLTHIYIWIPHPRDPEAGILHIVRNCCWFWDKHQSIGWSMLCWRWRGASLLGGWCWVRTTGCNSSWLFSCLSLKAIWVFLHAFVSLMLVTFVWSI